MATFLQTTSQLSNWPVNVWKVPVVNGVNFGLTLACWDYIFGTAYVPDEGRNNKLGFPGVEEFPDTFVGQSMNGFK